MKKQFALGFELDLDDLARRVNLPVITITNRHIPKAPKKEMRQRGPQRYDIIVNGRHLSVLAVRMSRVGVEQVFNVGCSPTSSIPEAVRVANLLSQESSRCRFLWQRRKLKIGPSHTRHPRIKSV